MVRTGNAGRTLALLIAFAALAACAKRAPAQSEVWPETPIHDSAPSGATALEVKGAINGGIPAYFTLDQLRALPKTEFSGDDPWVPGVTLYGGFSLYSFLSALRISEGARYVTLAAANDYTVIIDLADVRDQRYLITYEENGKPYAAFPDERNKGPLSVAIPHEDLEGIDMEVLKLNYVWWLKTIRVSE